ncbi:MAG: DoxX family protein [Bacteroidia bacterium]
MENQKKSKGMHIALWVAQGLLAAMFLMAGFGKAFQPIPELAKMLPWVTSMSPGLVRFIGTSELLGAFGLLLPSLLRIQPKLTSLAALGLVIVQVLAAGFHVMQGEASVIGMNFMLMAIGAFIAWGRFSKVPITPKSQGHALAGA